MLYVYAISDTRTEPGRPGLHGAPVRGFGAEPPFAITSEHRDSLAHPDEADLWAHERIIEDLMDRSTVLPMRFGSTVPDEASLLKILGERRGEFERLIDRVRGRVELSVRAQVIVAQPVPARSAALADAAGPGTTYLLERREIQGRADDALARIHEPLATLARQSARKTGGLRPGAFKGAYLVDRDRVEEFRARVGQLADEIEGARIVCTGPWPPYSFSAGSPE